MRHGGAGHQDPERARPQAGEVEVGRLALHLVLVLPLALGHVLEVEDGPALRVVERGRAVEGAEDEEEGGAPGHRLEAKAPTDRTGRKKESCIDMAAFNERLTDRFAHGFACG